MNPVFLQADFQLNPTQASSFAAEIDLFYYALWALTIVFTIGIAAAAGYLMMRYKRRSMADLPEHIHGSLILEITWSVIPLIISLGIFAWGAKLYYQIYTPPTDALEIYVTGKQWMWRAQHQNGVREINELHIPLGRAIKMTMTSEDVLHSYFIPAFRTKADVVPGRYTMTWFKPTQVGTYNLFCSEYCGTQHSGMIGKVHVMEQKDYQAWLTTGGGLTYGMTPAKSGEKLFTNLGCAACHKSDGNGRGPSLVGIYNTPQKLTTGVSVTADDAYIRESILNPRAKVLAGYEALMATYQGQVSEEQILDLIAYIKSVAKADATVQGEPSVLGTAAGLSSVTPTATAVAPAVMSVGVEPAAKPAAAAPAKPMVKPANK